VTTAEQESLMRRALEAAKEAAVAGEAPVGAVVTDVEGRVLSIAGNAPIANHDPTAHAEIRALRQAAAEVGNYRIKGAVLHVTLEPCAMCAGAISHARIGKLVIAASDPKGGAVWHGPKFFEQPTCHWRPEILQGPFAEESSTLLKEFFRARRKN